MLDTSVLLAKLETVAGTDSVPTVGADAFIVKNYQMTPFEAQEVRRNIDRGFAGANPSLPTAIHARHTFEVELCGSGAAATPAKWGTLLRGCMFGAPVTAADVTYPLTSTGDGSSLSIYGFKENGRAKGLMTRGNARFSFVEKQLPSLSFDYMSLISGSPFANAAPGAPTLPVYPAPVEVNLANTAISLDGFTLGVRSLEINLGMKTVFYSTTGGRAIIFDKSEDGDRRAVSFTLVAELPDPSVKEYFTALAAGTLMAFALTHGVTAGNIITMSSAVAMVTAITFSVENNRLFMNVTGSLVPSAANNELTLKTA